ncbi:MAG: hypothetical protein WC606_01220 [Candidatus Absconditabacterales bacterium]
MIDKAKDFFTVRNSLIVVICILSLILIIQNVHRYGGRKPSHNFGGSMTNSRGISGFPGMGGGMMGGGYAGRKGGN